MLEYDIQYQDVIRRILTEGKKTQDRTGVGAIGVFDVNMRVDLSRDDDKFTLPTLGLRKIYPRTSWYELFWMLRGSLDARELQEKNVKIWDGNSSREFLDSRGLYGVREGFIGSAGYGKWFRDFDGVDQLKELVEGIIANPYGRRHMISLWNPAELNDAALPACHVMYNFMIESDGTMHLKFFQRSQDFILANHANMLFAAFFLTWLADRMGYKVGSVSQSITNCHIYLNHVEVAEELLEREPVDHTATFELQIPWARFSVLDENTLDDEIDGMWNLHWDVIGNTIDYQSHERIDPSRLFMAV